MNGRDITSVIHCKVAKCLACGNRHYSEIIILLNAEHRHVLSKALNNSGYSNMVHQLEVCGKYEGMRVFIDIEAKEVEVYIKIK